MATITADSFGVHQMRCTLQAAVCLWLKLGEWGTTGLKGGMAEFKIWRRGMHLLNEWNRKTKTRQDTYLKEMTKRYCKIHPYSNKIKSASLLLMDLGVIWSNMRSDDLYCLFSSSQAYEEAQKKHKMAEEDQRKMVREFLYMHNNVLMLIIHLFM